MDAVALKQELERLYQVIESSEDESEIDATWEQISKLEARLSELLIREAKETGQEFVEPLSLEEGLPHAWHPPCSRPEVTCSGRKLVLRYATKDRDTHATVEFEGVRFFSLGEPTSAGLPNHDLWWRGLNELAAGKIVNSKRIAELNSLEPSETKPISNHYIFSFHDETFECIAKAFHAAGEAM